jgi:hypothetical protein
MEKLMKHRRTESEKQKLETEVECACFVMTHWCLISVAFVLELGWSLMWSAPLVMGSALVCLCVRQALRRTGGLRVQRRHRGRQLRWGKSETVVECVPVMCLARLVRIGFY